MTRRDSCPGGAEQGLTQGHLNKQGVFVLPRKGVYNHPSQCQSFHGAFYELGDKEPVKSWVNRQTWIHTSFLQWLRSLFLLDRDPLIQSIGSEYCTAVSATLASTLAVD